MDAIQYYDYKENKRHTPADFPYNVYPCTIPLDFPDVPLHWHDETEIIAVKKGSGIISVDLREERVLAGDIVLVLPGQLHAIRTYGRYEMKDGQDNLKEEGQAKERTGEGIAAKKISTEYTDESSGKGARFRNLHEMEYENIIFSEKLLLSSDTAESIYRALIPFFSMDRNNLRTPSFITGISPARTQLFSLIEETDRICDKRPEGWQIMVEANLLRFFFVLLQHVDESSDNADTGLPARNLDRLRKVTEYVGSHLAEKISIERMSGLTGYSETHFIRFFQKTTGLRFTDWLNRYRLSMATRLLTLSDDPITDVAAQTGFNNLSYFNRSFKQKYGMTPHEYRKQNR